jgi:hypothetical protein
VGSRKRGNGGGRHFARERRRCQTPVGQPSSGAMYSLCQLWPHRDFGTTSRDVVDRSIRHDSQGYKIRRKYINTDSENRKDVFKQHHRTHFAAGDKTDWYPVKVVPRLTGLLIAICV